MLLIIPYYLLIIALLIGLGLLMEKRDNSLKFPLEQPFISGAAITILFLFVIHFWMGSKPWLLIFLGAAASIGWYFHAAHWWRSLAAKWQQVKLIDQILLIPVLMAPLILTVLPSNLLDEGLYYGQSILWFEKMGWVPGLANFDVHLGQGSGIHALESLLNLKSVWRLNDLATLFLMVLLIDLWPQKSKHVFVLMGLVILFPLVSAPSGEVVLAVVILFLFLNSQAGFAHQTLWVCAAVLVKISALPLLLLLLTRRKFSRNLWILGILALVFAKSFYLTGYPLFPFSKMLAPPVSWRIPEVYFDQQAKLSALSVYDWGAIEETYQPHSISEKIQRFLFRPDLDTFLLWLGLIAIFINIGLFFTRKKPPSVWLGILLLFGSAWLFSSPQLRIAIPYILIFFALLDRYRNKSELPYFRYVLPSTYLLGLFLSSGWLTLFSGSPGASQWLHKRDFQANYLWKPAPVWTVPCKADTLNTISYGKPEEEFYCSYSCFPCATEIVQDYLHADSLYVPILLGTNLKTGFGYRAVPFDTNLVKSYNSLNRFDIRAFYGIENP